MLCRSGILAICPEGSRINLRQIKSTLPGAYIECDKLALTHILIYIPTCRATIRLPVHTPLVLMLRPVMINPGSVAALIAITSIRSATLPLAGNL